MMYVYVCLIVIIHVQYTSMLLFVKHVPVCLNVTVRTCNVQTKL